MPGKGASRNASQKRQLYEMMEKARGKTEEQPILFPASEWFKAKPAEASAEAEAEAVAAPAEEVAEVEAVVVVADAVVMEEESEEVKRKKKKLEERIEDDYERLGMFVGGGSGSGKKGGGGGGGDFDAEDRLIIRYDKDLAVPHLSTSLLRKPRPGRRSELNDEQRRTEWMLRRELSARGVRKNTIPRREITHARSHADVGQLVDNLQRHARSAGGSFLVGLDDEGGNKEVSPAMLQLSSSMGVDRVDTVVQLRSFTRGGQMN